MQNRNQFLNIGLTVLVASFTIILSQTAFFQRVELVALDAFFRLRNTSHLAPRPSKDIVIIQITNDDIRAVGRWPWRRQYLMEMTKALHTFGAADIFFDFLLSAPSDGPDDLLLQDSIKEARNVYLPSFLENVRGELKETMAPVDGLARYAKGVGFINIIPDIDGTLRRLPLHFSDNGRMYNNIVLEIAMDRMRRTFKAIRPGELILSGAAGEYRIPLTEENALMINWYGKWRDTYTKYGFLQVLQAYKDVSAGRRPVIDVGLIKNSICIVSMASVGLYDIKPTPLQTEYPGAGLVATALNNILDGHFITTVPLEVNVFFIYLVSFIPVWLIKKETPGKELFFVLCGLTVFLATYGAFLLGQKIMIFAPLVAFMGSYVVMTVNNFISPALFAAKMESHRQEKMQLEAANRELCENLKTVMGQKNDLARINRELERFVHTVSHDIRSPLLGLLGYADLLQQSIENNLDAEDKEILDGIFTSIDNLNEMIDGLLENTKITRINNPYEQADMNELIDAVRNRLAFIIKESRAELNIQKDLPSIVCDRIKMGEVFHNLIVNAIKFSAIKPGQPRIDIGYSGQGDFHQFVVRDNGIGIAAQHQKEIFEMFKRFTPPGQKPGWGIGLNIVQTAIIDHGGKVWVESQPDRGAAVIFTIPKNLRELSNQNSGPSI